MSSSANPAPDPPDRTRNDWLPRLDSLAYVGHAVVMWTFVVQRREKGWLHAESHSRFRELLLHSCHRYQLMCPVYVLMPDHAHLILMGLSECSDQSKAITFLRTHFKPTPFGWQKQAHDHVLRDDEQAQGAFQKIAQYILDNPARKSLTSAGQDWEYEGCLIPGYPRTTPADADYWQKFWQLYWKVRNEKTT